ncbi:1,2-diacylglycerol 3-alpha-glucosyltransferase [Breznakia sp. PF5-3]|uniref:glycosyltransferase n=1 Tax=unclassified Breznakia TaxID=2623764 RepID=UPI002405ACAF|nr:MULTISPECIES: RecX family transcriptional regulator [unclassified Breznakia]MDF9824003.1 1,2-diacylglycerol 3-alpha-glucosyltransferase [Breznakia sp. PM6-1]MDF9834802.1 1,2-diacylglycerol 3-alpha-glucosyltransferase [Breznakia sp. PF5-3]MDF9838121.1 1,2-diacylglycerol 3-alpha-glucosyltransferase [Breznakia sp. PFB2-8]MDF9860107.1 1,2-diacylglycerol 3-alpha-glucosyltransferase [Breznakia sp. PH5-24]
MRIGIFSDTYTPDINGVVSSVVTLQNALEAHGHEVYIITSHKGFIHSTREGNVLRMPGLELKWLYGYILSTPYHFTVKEEVEKLNLDVIHVQTEFGVGVFARIVARNLHIPVVYTYHTMYEDYTHYINRFDLDSLETFSKKVFSSFTKFLCESVTAIIAPSEKTKEALIRYGVKRPIHIIPTGLDLEAFKPENVKKDLCISIKEQFGISDSTKLITYIGRIAPEKSMEIIIDGFQYVKDPNVMMMIVGGGPTLDDLRKQAKDLGIADRIIFTDKQPREDMPAYYAISDAFVSASLSETQGMTFIESLAAGLPVFARKDEVLEELVFEGDTGFYFATPEEFAEKTDAFFALSKEQRVAFKQRCMEVVKKYDIENFYTSVYHAYEQAIEDYEECFLIESIKTSDDCMRLYLINKKSNEEVTLLVSLDDYLKYEIKKDGILEYSLYEVLKDKERSLTAYRGALKKLRSKDRTRKEMYDFLINMENPLDIKTINDLIDVLEEKGYINDEAYTLMQLEKMDKSLYGKQKMIRQLVSKGIPYEMIEEQLERFDESHEHTKAFKLALGYQDTIKNKSVNEKKEIIKTKLISNGFSSSLASEIVLDLNFEDDILKESVALQKVIDKAYRNYSRKYDGKALNDRIKQYALRKGFMYDDVVHAIEMRELNGE